MSTPPQLSPKARKAQEELVALGLEVEGYEKLYQSALIRSDRDKINEYSRKILDTTDAKMIAHQNMIRYILEGK